MLISALGATGRGARAALGGAGALGLFFGRTLRALFTAPLHGEGVLEQAVRVGVHSAAIVACIMFFIGANTAIVGHAIFSQFGGQSMIGMYVGLSSFIGVAPILVGALLAAKPGTEITATIASMRVKEQIDALEVMAVNPYWFLMVPRLLAFLLVTPALLSLAEAASIAGGYVASIYQLGVNPGTFVDDVYRLVTMGDLVKAAVRAEAFAVVIWLVSCFFGYHSKPGPAGVSRAINLAVVLGSTAIIVLNYVLTEVMY